MPSAILTSVAFCFKISNYTSNIINNFLDTLNGYVGSLAGKIFMTLNPFLALFLNKRQNKLGVLFCALFRLITCFCINLCAFIELQFEYAIGFLLNLHIAYRNLWVG